MAAPPLTDARLAELQWLADDAYQRREAGAALTMLPIIAELAATLATAPAERRAQLARDLARLQAGSALERDDPRSPFEELGDYADQVAALLDVYLGDRPAVPPGPPPATPTAALAAFLAAVAGLRQQIADLSPGGTGDSLRALAGSQARLASARETLTPPGALEQALHEFAAGLPHPPAPPIPAERLQRLQILAEDAFQRLHEGVSLLNLLSLEDAIGRLAATPADAPPRADLAEAARDLAAHAPDGQAARAAFADLTAYIRNLEGLLDEYAGARPIAPTPPAAPAPPGLSEPGAALRTFLQGLGRHRALLERLDGPGWAAAMNALASNRAGLARAQAALAPPGRLEQALADWRRHLEVGV